ncbi:hypothetical protein ABFU48_10615 [Xanthomonas campestris pv. raphani]
MDVVANRNREGFFVAPPQLPDGLTAMGGTSKTGLDSQYSEETLQ